MQTTGTPVAGGGPQAAPGNMVSRGQEAGLWPPEGWSLAETEGVSGILEQEGNLKIFRPHRETEA